MKKLVFASLLSVIAFASLQAQTNKEEVELFQSIFGMEKKAIVAEFVKVEGETGEAFWTLYDQYETERKELGVSRLELLNEYVTNYEQMSAEKMDELVSKMIKQKSSTDKLMNKYYKKIKSAAGSRPAAQFFQIENYFSSAIRLSIYENIPFIGELEK
jgi:Spy/CpxP family protein refolding chaperone